MKKTVFLLMILTLASRLLGLGREITLSYFYGASNLSDAYLISLTIPTVILGFIASGLTTGYIPIYRQLEATGGSTKKFTNQVINLVLLLCGFILILGTFFTPQLVKVFASGFDSAALDMTIQLTRITLFGVFFTGTAHILTGYLQVQEKYLATALVGIPFNVVIISFIVISYQRGLNYLAIGSVFASASQTLFLYVLSRKQGFVYRFQLHLKDRQVRQMIYLAFPVIIGTSVEQINRLVDKTLASQITVGGVSALAYAYRIMSAVQGIFIVSVLTVMYPHISKMAAEKNMIGMKKAVSEAIIGVSLFVVPAVVGVMVLAEPIVALLYGRGAFSEEAVTLTARILFFCIFAMFGHGIQDILARVFYALQDSKTPMFNATLALGLNIVLNIILASVMGISGLALATSLSAITAMLLMWRSLHKKIGVLKLKEIYKAFYKIVAASMVMGLVSRLCFHCLAVVINSNLALILAIGVGGSTYLILILLMKIEAVESVLNSLLNSIRKGVTKQK